MHFHDVYVSRAFKKGKAIYFRCWVIKQDFMLEILHYNVRWAPRYCLELSLVVYWAIIPQGASSVWR